MDATNIRTTLERVADEFREPCGKYTGALTIEVIRRELEKAGVAVSARDVFIRGVPVEIDLIIAEKGAKARYGIEYDPKDVLAAIEVKRAGSWGATTIRAIKRSFTLIRKSNHRIRCCYVTVQESKSYGGAVTKRNSGGDVYTLRWWCGSSKGSRSHGDWERFLQQMKRLRG
jgi:hypothetical protein